MLPSPKHTVVGVISLAFVFASPVWSRSSKPSGQTSVQVEMHTSTTSFAPDADIKGSTMSANTVTKTTTTATNAPKTTTAPATAAVNTPDPAQIEKINQYMKELRGQDSYTWPRAAKGIHELNPNLAVPASVLNRMVRIAYAPAERERTRSGWLTACTSQNNALDALANLGLQAHSTIPHLVRLSHRVCIHEHLAQAMGEVGEPDADQLAQIAAGLSDKDPDARQAAVEYLSNEKQTPELIRTLGRAMNDANSGVRLSALQGLERFQPEGEGRIPVLAAYLKDPSPQIRERALYMIGQLGPGAHAAVAPLRQALHDSDPLIALESAKYLAKVDPQDDDLITTLIAFTKKKDTAAARQAIELLQSLEIHEARIDNALEPFRRQESLKQRLNKTDSGMTPEKLADNARTLKIQRLRVASRIVRGEAVNVAKSFHSDVGRIYCWTEVSISTPPAGISYRWYRDGHLAHEDEFEVSSATQTLWSSSPVRAGHWKVDVTPSGSSEPLATAVFSITKRQ
jgi:HEAT repeat protein